MPKRLFAAAVFLLVTFACGKDSDPLGTSSPVGTYQLQQINGRMLPVGVDTSFNSGGVDCIRFALRGTVTISASSRFVASGTVREDCQGDSQEHSGSIEGTWTEQDGGIGFFPDGRSETMAGSLSGANLVVIGGAQGQSGTAIFVRQ